jgi:transcriptional regulator with XRE-family HTH domain
MSLLRFALGRVLRRIRQAQGRTLQEVADTAGVSMAYLSEVERGRKEVSSELLAVICRALGIALPDLLEEVRSELLRTAPRVALARSFVCAGRRAAVVTAGLSRRSR